MLAASVKGSGRDLPIWGKPSLHAKAPRKLCTTLNMLEPKLEEGRVGLFCGGKGDDGEKAGVWTGNSGELAPLG